MTAAREHAYGALALRAIVDRLDRVLETFFGGYYLMESPALNDIYLLLVKNIKNVAEPFPDVKAALDEMLDIVPNLYESIGHEDSADENWEFGGQQALRQLKARVSEVWVSHYDGQVQLSEPDSGALRNADELINKCKDAKDAGWRKIMDRARRSAEEFREQWEQGSQAHTATTQIEAVAPTTQDQRLQDEAHAACVEALVSRLRGEGHDARPEGTYSRYGERGSVDVYYFEQSGGTSLTGCAIYEVWTQVDNINLALRKLDEKARVFPVAYAEAKGTEKPPLVRAHFVVLATKQNMEVLAEHIQTFEAKFSESLTDGTRFSLDVFDPITNDLETLLPLSPGQNLQSQTLHRWSRFPLKSAFIQAWRKRSTR